MKFLLFGKKKKNACKLQDVHVNLRVVFKPSEVPHLSPREDIPAM